MEEKESAPSEAVKNEDINPGANVPSNLLEKADDGIFSDKEIEQIKKMRPLDMSDSESMTGNVFAQRLFVHDPDALRDCKEIARNLGLDEFGRGRNATTLLLYVWKYGEKRNGKNRRQPPNESHSIPPRQGH